MIFQSSQLRRLTSGIDMTNVCEAIRRGFFKVLFILTTSTVIAVIVSYLYVDSLSFQHALKGTALLLVAQWGFARFLGFRALNAGIIVAAGVVVFLIDQLTSGLLTISHIGTQVGVPTWIVSATAPLSEASMETITIPIFLLLLLGIGYRFGWLGLVLLGAYDLMIPKPISVVFDNGMSGAPRGTDSWPDLALKHIQNAPGIIVILAIGMCGYVIGRWWARRKSRVEPAFDGD